MKKTSNIQNIVKGILICTVIFFHSKICVDYSALVNFNVLYLMFPCIIGIFFFYSGYNYSPGKRTPKESIKRRTKQLLIPLLIIWIISTILVVPMLLLTNSVSLDTVKQSYIYVTMSEPWAMINGMSITDCSFDIVLCIQSGWFLYTLWIVSCVFYLIVDYINEKLSRHIITVIILLTLSFLMGKFLGTYLPFVVNCYPVALAIMLTAAYLKKKSYLDKEESKLAICTKAITFELIIILISTICYLVFGANVVGSLMGGKFNDVITGFDAYIGYIFAVIGTYIIHNLSKLICKIPLIGRILEKFGENSAYVYITHGIVISYIDTLIFHKNHEVFNAGIQSSMYLALAIVIYIVLYKIFKRRKKENEQRN